MSLLQGKRRRRPELNLVPLIDVLVMLIFFAFVTMQFKSASVLNITLPKVQTAGKNELTGKVEVAVDKDGKLSLNGKLIEEKDLESLLAQVQRVNKDTPILIRADEISQFGKVTQVMDVCRKLGLNKLVIETRK